MEVKDNQSMESIILETAERLFLEKGFAMTSTTEIAKEVGCNQALVHYYFRTKENLFNVIFEQKFKEFFHYIFDLYDLKELSFTDKLRKIIETHFDMVRKNSKIPYLIINEFSRKPEQVREMKEKLKFIPKVVIEQLNNELEVEIAAGRIRRVSLMDLILSVVSLNISLFLLMPIASEIFEMTEIQKQMVIENRKSEHVIMILNSLRP
jgi:TetR/AcrR family transcriptional regulator